MRPVRIIATVVLAAALAGTDRNRAQPGYRLVRHRPEDGTGGCPGHPDLPRVAASEQVDVTFGTTVLTSAKASTGGEVATSFAVPSGFAGSHYPGQKGHLPGHGPPERQGPVGDVHGNRLSSSLAEQRPKLTQGEHHVLVLAPATTGSLSEMSHDLLLAQPALLGSYGHGVLQGVVGGAVSDLGLDGVEAASLGGGDSMVAVGQDESLVAAEGNHRRQVAWQLGVAAHTVGVQMGRRIDKAAGPADRRCGLGSCPAMVRRRCVMPWYVRPRAGPSGL